MIIVVLFKVFLDGNKYICWICLYFGFGFLYKSKEIKCSVKKYEL